MTERSPNVAMNSLKSCAVARADVARSEKQRLAEHQVSCRDAGERAEDLSGDINRHFAPG